MKNQNNNDFESVIAGSFTEQDNIVDHAYTRAKALLISSPFADRLIRRIESVGKIRVKTDFNNARFLSVYPKKFTEEKTHLHYVSKISDLLTLITDHALQYVTVVHPMRGFEDIFSFSVQIEPNGEKHKYCYVTDSETEFLNALRAIPCHIVFDKMKLLSAYKKTIGKCIHALPIFIYIDIPLINVVLQIKDMFYKAKYSYYTEDEYDVLIIDKK